MSQANANLFGGDFFPTPRQVARKMLASNSVMSSKIWREAGIQLAIEDIVRLIFVKSMIRSTSTRHAVKYRRIGR